MSKRNKLTLLCGFMCSVVCSVALTGGGAALAEPAPGSNSETLLSITANRLPLLQSDRKGGFLKAELSGKEIQLNRVTASGQLATSVLSVPEQLSSLNGFTQTADGGYLLAGHAADDSSGQLKIVKISPSGAAEWEQATNQVTDYTPAYFQESKEGAIVMAATRKGQTTANDIYLLKLGSDGSKQWEHVISGPYNEAVHALSATGDGGVVLTGEWQVGTSDGKINRDLYTAKYDADGNRVWERKQETGGDTTGNGVAETHDGGFIIAGNNAGLSYVPAFSGYLLKLNSKGEPVWEKQLPASLQNSYANQIQEDKDGNLIVAGTVNHHLINMGTHEADGYLLKLDPDGSPIWDKVLEGGGRTYRNVSNIQLTPEGYLAIGSIEKFRGVSSGMILTKLNAGNKPVPSTLSFNKEGYKLTVGQSVYSVLTSVYGGQTMDVTRYGELTVDNPAVASVDSTGRISGLQSGDTVLRAVYGGASSSAKVHVEGTGNPALKFDSTEYSIIVGQSLDTHLYATNGEHETEITTGAHYEWSDPAIASIDEKGNITGHKYGTTELTATYQGRKTKAIIYVY